MQKIRVLLTILTISLILCTFLVSAEDSQTLQDLQQKADQARNIQDQIKQDKTAFLLNSWTEFLSKTSIGRAIIQIGSILEYLSPVFVAFVGMKYELSWLFFISVIVVIWFGMLLYRAIKVFASNNNFIALILTLAILGLITRRSTVQNGLLFFAPLFSNPIIMLLTVVIGTAIVFAINIIMKRYGKKLEEEKKKELEAERETKEKKLDKIKEVKLIAEGAD